MLKLVYDIVSKLDAELWLYVLLGIVVLVFLVGVVLTLVTGEANKFAKQAKQFLKDPQPQNAKVTANLMPSKVKKAYKRSLKTGEKPSDVISVDTCVNAPYSMGAGNRVTKAVLLVTLLLSFVSYYITVMAKESEKFAELVLEIGESAYCVLPVAIGLVGLLLAAISGLVASLNYNGLVKTYNKYVDELDRLSKGGNYEGDVVASSQENVSHHVVNQVQNDDDNAVVASDERFKTFETPTKLNIEIEEDVVENDDNTIITESVTITEETVETTSSHNDMRNEIEEEIRREKEAREAEEKRKEEERQANVERIKALAEEKRRAAQAAEQAAAVITPPPPVVEKESVEVTPTVNATAANKEQSLDALIARIDQISAEGATLPEMKEVALQLQQERAKPENKAPDVAKRLNESLSKLLKAMSSARK